MHNFGEGRIKHAPVKFRENPFVIKEQMQFTDFLLKSMEQAKSFGAVNSDLLVRGSAILVENHQTTFGQYYLKF